MNIAIGTTISWCSHSIWTQLKLTPPRTKIIWTHSEKFVSAVGQPHEAKPLAGVHIQFGPTKTGLLEQIFLDPL